MWQVTDQGTAYHLSSEPMAFYEVERYLLRVGRARLLTIKEIRAISDWSHLNSGVYFWTANRIKCSVQAVGFVNDGSAVIEKFDKTFGAHVYAVRAY